MLIGSLSVGALSGCDSGVNSRAPIDVTAVYTNNYRVPGVGFYHAPFRRWYPVPYNQFDPQSKRYYYDGAWHPAPHESITNISNPLPEAAAMTEATRTDIARGGFGSTSHYHGIYA